LSGATVVKRESFMPLTPGVLWTSWNQRGWKNDNLPVRKVDLARIWIYPDPEKYYMEVY